MPQPDDLKAILDRIAADTYSDQDLQRLSRLITVRGDRNIVQFGRYNVHLDDARNIHIGDRIYRGVEAETIRYVLADVLQDSGWGNQIGRGSLRGVSGFIMTIGVVIALIGTGLFIYGLLSVMQESGPTSGPPPVTFVGFAMAFIGVLVGGIGQLVRGWERPQHGR